MKVLVAFDGSPVAKHALREALTLVKAFREPPELHVAAVADYVVAPAGLGKAPDGAPDLLAQEAQTALAIAAEIAHAQGVPAETRVLRGHVAAEVLRYADEIGAGLIVLGTHGRKGLARAVLGSACEQVVRESPIPVVTVHGDKGRAGP